MMSLTLSPRRRLQFARLIEHLAGVGVFVAVLNQGDAPRHQFGGKGGNFVSARKRSRIDDCVKTGNLNHE